MNRKTTLKIATMALAATPLEAAILHPLNPLKVIEVKVSEHDLTRIAVQDDRIRHVFGNSGDYSLEADDTQGQVFIKPLKENSIALTLTTENGHTQDLRLMPKDIPSETIILTKKEPATALGRGSKKSTFKDPLHRSAVEDLLQACHDQRIPQGYREIPVNLQESLHLHPLIRELRGSHLRGLTFELKISVSELKFARQCGVPREDIVAILMPSQPQKRGYAYVIARTHQ